MNGAVSSVGNGIGCETHTATTQQIYYTFIQRLALMTSNDTNDIHNTNNTVNRMQHALLPPHCALLTPPARAAAAPRFHQTN